MIFKALVSACVVLVIPRDHPSSARQFSPGKLAGLYALWGFVSLFAIVVLGKRLVGASSDEDTYDE